MATACRRAHGSHTKATCEIGWCGDGDAKVASQGWNDTAGPIAAERKARTGITATRARTCRGPSLGIQLFSSPSLSTSKREYSPMVSGAKGRRGYQERRPSILSVQLVINSQSSCGLSNLTLIWSKSFVFRVTRVIPCTSAVAAIRASISGIGSGTCRPAATVTISSVTG